VFGVQSNRLSDLPQGSALSAHPLNAGDGSLLPRLGLELALQVECVAIPWPSPAFESNRLPAPGVYPLSTLLLGLCRWVKRPNVPLPR
jgi:hypothetical protein